jgi:hypothetical protein
MGKNAPWKPDPTAHADEGSATGKTPILSPFGPVKKSFVENLFAFPPRNSFPIHTTHLSIAESGICPPCTSGQKSIPKFGAPNHVRFGDNRSSPSARRSNTRQENEEVPRHD